MNTMQSREFVINTNRGSIENRDASSFFPEKMSVSTATKSRHKVSSMPRETMIDSSCITGKSAYYALTSILAFGILMLIAIPIGSTFLYIDYKQQLEQRKSNKNDLCKSKCSYGAECILDEFSNQALCRCPFTECTDDYEPICGSDGNTYVNLCYLRLESCNKQQPISVLTNSACDANLCHNVTCHRYQKCQVDERTGKPKCVCPINCESNKQEQLVCASNNKFYNSLCELQKHACFYNLNIVPTNLSFCVGGQKGAQLSTWMSNGSITPAIEKCGPRACANYAQCKSSSLNQTRVCTCPVECGLKANDPVCGINSDGFNRNFANICELRCLQEDFKFLHFGQCGQCSEQCEHYSECKRNELNVPTCMCQSVCESVDRPVCGDNGVTYMNICELRVDSCRLKKRISVRWNGSCDRCHNVLCHHGATCVDGNCVCTDHCENEESEPLCANDGTTYINECDMNRKACLTKKELNALFYGKCEEASDKLLEDDPATAPFIFDTDHSELLLNLEPTKCHHSFQACNKARVVDDVYVCENKVFGTKCEMMQYKCLNAGSEHNCDQYCHCSRYGLKPESSFPCNSSNGQCACKTGVAGLRCDRCDKNYWNFKQVIDNPFSDGCKPCECNRMGSLSTDCDKVTGECRCRAGVKGDKCDRCPHNLGLSARGCVPYPRARSQVSASDATCQNHKCHHGAICRHNGTHPYCSCQLNCSQSTQTNNPICASDGSKHTSMCHFREYSCHIQKNLHVIKHCVN